MRTIAEVREWINNSINMAESFSHGMGKRQHTKIETQGYLTALRNLERYIDEVCEEKISVVLTPLEDRVKKRIVLELSCCLTAPHPEYKHQNPRIQRTVGGERRTYDPEWSYYLEKKSQSSLKPTA